MNNQEENIPIEIFDWINTFSFEELEAKQQAQVIIWFTPDTYNQIHLAAKQASLFQASLSRKAAIKEHLSYQFELNNKNKPWLNKTIPWWQAAAAILIVSAFFIHLLIQQKTPKNNPLLSLTDSTYLKKQMASKPIEPIIIYDTVYLQETKQLIYSQLKKQKLFKKESERATNAALPIQVLVQSMETLESTYNQIKGNSLKDDTLLHTYGFVRL
jgi:hypothetical protein